MKYIRFDTRLKKNDLDIMDIAVHAVNLLDHAAVMAIDNKDHIGIIEIYDKMLEASDRLTSVALHLEGEEEEYDESKGNSGFKLGFHAEPVDPSGDNGEEDSGD